MAGNRDYSLDALKMILIILVIYAHIPLLNGLIPIGANVECDALTWHSVKGYICLSYAIVCVFEWIFD